MAVDLGFEWPRIAPVSASASPVETAVEPIVCLKRMGSDSWQPRLLDGFRPDALRALVVPVPAFRRKDEFRALLWSEAAQDSDCRHAERTNRFSGLAVS